MSPHSGAYPRQVLFGLTLWCLINDPTLIADPMADFQWNSKQPDPNCQLDGTFLGKINSRPYVLCSKVIQIRDSMNFNQKYLIDSMEIWPSRCNFDENINKNLESLIRHHRVGWNFFYKSTARSVTKKSASGEAIQPFWLVLALFTGINRQNRKKRWQYAALPRAPPRLFGNQPWLFW